MTTGQACRPSVDRHDRSRPLLASRNTEERLATRVSFLEAMPYALDPCIHWFPFSQNLAFPN